MQASRSFRLLCSVMSALRSNNLLIQRIQLAVGTYPHGLVIIVNPLIDVDQF